MAKPKGQDRSSLATPKEYLSVVVGGRSGSKDLVGDIRSPDPRIAFPAGSSDDNSQSFTDRRGSKASKIQHRILSDKLSSVHSEESEENYVAEYDVTRKYEEEKHHPQFGFDPRTPQPTARGGRFVGQTDLHGNNGHLDFLNAIDRDLGNTPILRQEEEEPALIDRKSINNFFDENDKRVHEALDQHQ